MFPLALSHAQNHPAHLKPKPAVTRLSISPAVGVSTVQRQSRCACGGGCPRCQSDRTIPGLQTKLAIGEPGDRYEQEADRVADQVMRMPALAGQSQPPPEDKEIGVQRQAISHRGTATSPSASPTAPAQVNDVLSSPGHSLDGATRSFMESRFGQDFSGVRVHTDGAAGQSAQQVNAHAFTVGQDIVFGAGQFRPNTQAGQRQIAHELTHVVQQTGPSAAPTLQRDPIEGAIAFADAPELEPGWERQILEILNDSEDVEFKEIELQGILLNADVDIYAALYARLSPDPPPKSDRFARKFRRVFRGAPLKRLLKRYREVGQHYRPKVSDPNPELPPDVAPGRQTQKLREMGRIDAPKGVYLRSRPGSKDTDTLLPFDTLVAIERKTIEAKGKQSWLYVVALGDSIDGSNVTGFGFVEEYFVAKKPPEPTAHLYRVRAGDKLKDIAAKFYKQNFDEGNDARLYVQAIYHANQERDVVFRQKLDLSVNREALKTSTLKEAHVLWREARVVAGQALWVPSDAFVQKLKAAGVIHHASISKAIWDATVGAVQSLVDWAQYTAGFVVGLLEGAWDALKDLFTGAWDLIKAIGAVIKALFTDWDEIKAFGKKLATLWENRTDILDAIATDFLKKWESPNDYDRGSFQGEVLGYVMMTAFIILVTLGAGAVATAGGRLGNFIKLIQFADRAGDISTYAGKLASAAKLPARVVGEAKDKVKGTISTVAKVEAKVLPKAPSGTAKFDLPNAPPPRPPAVKPAVDMSSPTKETVEQFEQRGGKIERLPPRKTPKTLPSEVTAVSQPKPPEGFEDLDVPTRTEKQAGVRVEEDHHVLTRYRQENKKLFEKIGFTVDDDFNLIKNFREHGEMRGWEKWDPKKKVYVHQQRGHHPEYNLWATEKVKAAIKGLRGKKRQAAFQAAVEEIAAIVERYPDVLAYGPKIFAHSVVK